MAFHCLLPIALLLIVTLLPTSSLAALRAFDSTKSRNAEDDPLPLSFHCKSQYGSELLPEIGCYSDALVVMSSIALASYNQKVPADAITYNNVELAYGGIPVGAEISRKVLLLGLYRSVEQFARERRFLTVKFSCFNGIEPVGLITYEEPKALGANNQTQQNSESLGFLAALRIDGSSASDEACARDNAPSNRPICFKYEFLGTPVTHGDYYQSIAGLLLTAADQDKAKGVQRPATNRVDGLTTLITRNRARPYLPATLTWEDAISMLYRAVDVATNKPLPTFRAGYFEEILVSAYYQTGGQELWLGDLRMRRLGEPEVSGNSSALAAEDTTIQPVHVS